MNSVRRLPWLASTEIRRAVAVRALRLNCLTEVYADLWESAFHPDFTGSEWAFRETWPDVPPLGHVDRLWSPSIPLRRAIERRQACIEIDALVAIGLGVTVDELCTIYRTQFSVLSGYDRAQYLYDANGRLVPTEVRQAWLKKGEHLTVEERTAVHPAGMVYTYELPFRFLDREADMRAAHAEFERRLAERGTA